MSRQLTFHAGLVLLPRVFLLALQTSTNQPAQDAEFLNPPATGESGGRAESRPQGATVYDVQ